MAGRVVYFSGEFVPERDANVSIFDCALMYGDMAFEMTRTFAGTPFKLREHLERLYGSLRLLEIDCGLTIDEMEEQTLLTLEKNRSTEEDGIWEKRRSELTNTACSTESLRQSTTVGV